jgi:hypothetical protein
VLVSGASVPADRLSDVSLEACRQIRLTLETFDIVSRGKVEPASLVTRSGFRLIPVSARILMRVECFST